MSNDPKDYTMIRDDAIAAAAQEFESKYAGTVVYDAYIFLNIAIMALLQRGSNGLSTTFNNVTSTIMMVLNDIKNNHDYVIDSDLLAKMQDIILRFIEMRETVVYESWESFELEELEVELRHTCKV